MQFSCDDRKAVFLLLRRINIFRLWMVKKKCEHEATCFNLWHYFWLLRQRAWWKSTDLYALNTFLPLAKKNCLLQNGKLMFPGDHLPSHVCHCSQHLTAALPDCLKPSLGKRPLIRSQEAWLWHFCSSMLADIGLITYLFKGFFSAAV